MCTFMYATPTFIIIAQCFIFFVISFFVAWLIIQTYMECKYTNLNTYVLSPYNEIVSKFVCTWTTIPNFTSALQSCFRCSYLSMDQLHHFLVSVGLLLRLAPTITVVQSYRTAWKFYMEFNFMFLRLVAEP